MVSTWFSPSFFTCYYYETFLSISKSVTPLAGERKLCTEIGRIDYIYLYLTAYKYIERER